MAESVVSFDVVTFHARGAWLLVDGEMTHSADGSATLASGEIVSFDCARYFNRAAPAGERTTYRVTLYSASRRELTASKWEALRGEIRRTFKGHVESMADGPRPAAIKPGTDSPATRKPRFARTFRRPRRTFRRKSPRWRTRAAGLPFWRGTWARLPMTRMRRLCALGSTPATRWRLPRSIAARRRICP